MSEPTNIFKTMILASRIECIKGVLFGVEAMGKGLTESEKEAHKTKLKLLCESFINDVETYESNVSKELMEAVRQYLKTKHLGKNLQPY